MQTYTSKATSINSARLPAVYGKAKLTAPYVLDYGCGKYTDHIRNALPDKVYLPFDPYNQPDDVNCHSMMTVSTASSLDEQVDVICSNVLNVIDDDGTVRFIADQIEYIAERTGGTAYITVYEGDRSGIGRQTGKDQYQRNEPLRSYLRFFRNATVKNGMIVVER